MTIRLFGGLTVLRAGTALVLPQSRKTRALLGFLAATGRSYRRDRLCELFWQVPDDPRAALRWSLSRLRPVLDGADASRLIADRENVALDLAGVDVDVRVVHAAARAAETLALDELKRAGDLVEGVALAGLELPESHEYQAWLVTEREAARHAGKQVLRALVRRMESGDDARLAFARKLAALAPEDEEAQAALIAALVASGRRGEAEQQAAILQAQLSDLETPDTGAVRRALAGDGASDAPAAHVATAAAPASAEKPSIAVLPFANSGAEIDGYLVDGVVDAITDALACYSWLFVITRQSAFAFEGEADPRVAAKALGVRYLLTGSVMRGAERVRIVCRLIDGETGAQVWIDRFDRNLGDIFELQDEISTAVASRLQPTLISAETSRARRKPTEALDAYDYYLRALPFVYLPQGRGHGEAIAHMQEALRRDPQFAPAMAMLANLRLQNRAYMTPAEIAESVSLARRAAQLGRDDARVLSIASFVIGYGAHDFDTADALVDRALAVNANSYAAWTAKAWAHIFWRDVTQAESCLDLAERLSPRDPFHYLLQAARASALFQMGRYEEAATHAQAATATNPTFEMSLQFLTAALAELGRAEEAAAALKQLSALAPHQDLAFLRQSMPFRPAARIEKLIAALKRAGMPERVTPN